jgi:thioredoxin reductase
MNEKSIIIIGGGLTGLSAGCYGRMNGYRTSILRCTALPEVSAPPGSAKAIPLTVPLTG